MTALNTLEDELRIMIGDTELGAYQWQPEQILDLIVVGLRQYNQEEPPHEYEITGSGDARALNPTPTSDNLRLILLYTALQTAISEESASVRSAVKRNTPLGSADFTSVPYFWGRKVHELRSEIRKYKKNAAHVVGMAGMEAREISISEPNIND